MKFRTLFVGLVCATGLVASGCADGENGADGAQGATGPAGEQGAPGATGDQGATGATGDDGAQGDAGDPGTAGTDGDDGTDGVDGTDGDDGANAVCADTPALMSVTVAGLDTELFVGIESAPFTLTVMDADGTDVTATTELDLVGAEFGFTPGATAGEYTVTPRVAGEGFSVVVIGADGCSTVLGDIVVAEVEVFAARVDVVHVFDGAPATVDLALAGTTDVVGSVNYGSSLGFTTIGTQTVTFDVLDPADGSVITTTPELTFNQGDFVTVVVHDDGAGAVGFTPIVEDLSSFPTAPDTQLSVFHAAAGVGPVDVSDDTGAIVFDDVAFGALSDSVMLDASVSYLLGVDIDQDAVADLTWSLPSNDIFPDEQSVAFVYVDTASGEVRIHMRTVIPSGTTFSANYVLAVNLGPPDVEVDSAAALGLVLDGTTPVQSDTITVAAGTCATLVGLTVDVDASHAYLGDIQVTLTAPSGTSYQLIDGAFINSVDFIGEIADGAADSNFDPATRGTDTLADVVAAEAAGAEGDWTLELEDTFTSSDDGTFNSWGLNLYCQ